MRLQIFRSVSLSALVMAWFLWTAGARAEDQMFERGDIAEKVASASAIVLCTDVPEVLAIDFAEVARRLHPDRRPPLILSGLDSSRARPPGFVVYAYLGGKIPSHSLRTCAASFPSGSKSNSAAIEGAHGGVGVVPNFITPPPGYRIGPTTFNCSGTRGETFINIFCASDKDGREVKESFIRSIFGLTIEYCLKHCSELLKAAERD